MVFTPGPPRSAIVPPHPINSSERLLLYPFSPQNRLWGFFPGKNARPLAPPPMQERLSCLQEPPAAPLIPRSSPPPHTGFNEAALIRIVWVCVPLGIKLHTQEGRVWLMFAWWSGKVRVHMAPNHVQHHSQQKHVMSLRSFETRFRPSRLNSIKTRT